MQVEDLKNRLDQADTRFYAYKKEIDESPISVLRQELAQKNIELIELQSKITNSNTEKEEFKKKYELIRKDMVTLKKTRDREKEEELKKTYEENKRLEREL